MGIQLMLILIFPTLSGKGYSNFVFEGPSDLSTFCFPGIVPDWFYQKGMRPDQ